MTGAVARTDQRVAIVTGASQGIGAGIVAGYRQRGWAVVANALTIKPSDDPDVLAVEGDVSQTETGDRVVGEALRAFGRVDTLINDAGVYIGKAFTDYSSADYARMIAVNLTGFFTMTQRVIPEMLKNSGGHVVTMSATVAENADAALPAALAALTKGGLASATRSLAIEYAGRGIRFNTVSPGIIQTPLHDPASYASSAQHVPMGRVGQIDDIVQGVLFLESSPYITGETLHIDGGQVAGHT